MSSQIKVDPFPYSLKSNASNIWIYGRSEREVFRQQQLIRAKNFAQLKVGYPGEFMLPHNTVYFRAEFPAGVFPVKCVGTPVVHEICMDKPGVFEFSLAVPDTEIDVPCFCCSADVSWESSTDGKIWNKTVGIPGGDEPPHQEKLPYIRLIPERLENGLYDVGREIWGNVVISNAPEAKLYVGESVGEAENRDPDGFEQRLDLVERDEQTLCSAVPLAFRYISLDNASDKAEICVEAFYTPLDLQKKFSCGDEELDLIWEQSVYTLRLCTYYFLIDGVKRDRLPWAGDLAVSLLSMTESFCEPSPIRDTLAVLGSAGIRNSHINGIVDYSLWYLINFELYTRCFGDMPFLQQEYFKITETVEILLSQRQENGLLPVNGWVLIDWAEGDKNCALQVLFYIALKASAKLAERMDDHWHRDAWLNIAKDLRETIRRDFYDSESGLFRCSPGSNEFLRHQNFLAVGTVATANESRRIGEQLLSDKLPAVGTPYMKTFEILGLIRAGFKEQALAEIRRFWGGMNEVGATTYFEAYGEGNIGQGLYDFYNRPYGLSLCHAWSSAPAFLLPMIFGSSDWSADELFD